MAKRIRAANWKDLSELFPSLSSALFEWLLMILLSIHALSSFLSLKLARCYKLPAPCILCSRLEDSRIGELLCDRHKSEISSLAFCTSHCRLADARDMCGGCLASFVGATALDGGLSKEAVSMPATRCTCCYATIRSRPLERTLRDGLCRVGCNELKITSDSESEVPPSDDGGATRARATDDVKDEFFSRGLKPEPTTVLPENITLAISDSPFIPEAPLTDVERKLEVGASNSTVGIGQGLEEINWSKDEVRPNPYVSSEITSEQVLQEGLNTNPHASEVEVTNGEATKAFGSTDISLKASQLMNEKLTAGIRPPLPSSASTDLIAGREPSRVPEDMKVRLSQISSARWSEFPWNDMTSSPRVNGQGDEPRLSDASSSTGILTYFKRYSMDRCESGLDSLDGSLVGEVEGESAVDRLKRQIEMDRKSMSILYKELEEERNASAIAANQAMAMINRLQEEKASMHMEALQYLRLMEEQSEYDQEALQKLNDLLADRDKEIQDLEAEVNSYRKQYGGEPWTSRVLEPLEDSEEREYTPVSTPRFVRSRGCEIGSNLVNPLVGNFEDEKVYISKCLKNLEKKLQSFSNSRLSACGSRLDVKEDSIPDRSSLLEENETSNGDYTKVPLRDNSQECSQCDNGTLENSRKGELIMSKDLSSREESHVIKCFTPSSAQPVQFSFKEALKESTLRSISYNERQFQMTSKRTDIVTLGNEISQLSARLEALEADRSFLEYAVDALRNGSDGIQFIKEIACHLRELRKIGITRQQQATA